MNYAERYKKEKAYWDSERQRRRINRILTGQKFPGAESIIQRLQQEGIEMDKKERAEFYSKMPLPNPPARKKKKKKQNGYKDKPERYCFFTGRPYAERHELFGGANRQISIDHGFQVDVCWQIHKLFHGQVDWEGLKEIGWEMEDPLRWAAEQQESLRKVCQMEYEARERLELGVSTEEARERWMNLIGRNYLD